MIAEPMQNAIGYQLIWFLGAAYLLWLIMLGVKRIVRLLIGFTRIGREWAEFVDQRRRKNQFQQLTKGGKR